VIASKLADAYEAFDERFLRPLALTADWFKRLSATLASLANDHPASWINGLTHMLT
jgi:hypothetical protein